MRMFGNLRPRDKLTLLTSVTFTDTLSDRSWLKTVPDKAKPCLFLADQLRQVHATVRDFTFSLNDAEKTLVEDFVYTEAPSLIAEGWNMRDIVSACHDYLESHRVTLDIELKNSARSMLMEDMSQTKWYNKFYFWLGCRYFDSPRFATVCNTIAGWSPVRWVVAKYMAPKYAVSIFEVTNAARERDHSLGGNNPWLKNVLFALASASFIILIVKLCQRFKKSPSPVVQGVTFDVSDAPDASIVEAEAISFEVITDDTRVSTQADIMTTGKRPVVREGEKVNVWKQEVRDITKLDVSIRCCDTWSD